MKELLMFIQEKLIINKDSKLKHNIDSLNDDDMILISDRNTDSKPSDDDLEEIIDKLDDIDKKIFCAGYLIMKSVSLSKSKNLEKDIIDIDQYLYRAIKSIINYKDLEHEIRIVGGHIEIDCINFDSCCTYYIYAIESTAWGHLEDWWSGDEETKSLAFLFAKNSIVPIEYK